jgi:hypothetical protein
MVLSTAKIEDFDRFWSTFSTKGAEKRKQHGSKGSHVFRDPNDDRRIWVVFDWDEEGFTNFVSDPDMAAILAEGGDQDRPQAADSPADTARSFQSALTSWRAFGATAATPAAIDDRSRLI